jgi:hypothetical protein
MSVSHIFTGPWINHSHSLLIGATLTLDDRNSAFLLAFLAIIVTTAGNSFWVTVSFIIHQLRSKPVRRDGIFYQHQTVLKNSTTPIDAAWKFVQISFAWRRHDRTKWWQFWRSRTFGFMILTILIASAVGTAGIFSSQVTKSASTEVLIQSDFCGSWEFPDTDNLLLKILDGANTAANYARNCYGEGNSSNSQCERFVVPNIPWTAGQNASCPFESGNCVGSDKAAYEMSTGLLDSHDILGLNARESERVQIRKVATCAPITLDPYTEWVNLKNSIPTGPGTSAIVEDTYLRLYVGQLDDDIKWTYQYNAHTVADDIEYNLVYVLYPFKHLIDSADVFLALFNTLGNGYQHSRELMPTLPCSSFSKTT